ncbi:MAG TPA: PAS domain-containing protein [Longimicrobiales bacterium]|nr:PAS domain-containing protein [Longimicrobiales bacterium]
MTAPPPETLQAMGAALSRSIHVPVLILDRQGTIRFANTALHGVLGAEAGSLAGTELRALIPPEDADRAAALWAADPPPPPVELTFRFGDSGSDRLLSCVALPMGGGDVLILASGPGPKVRDAIRKVAHDLNNVLLTVMTYTDLLGADAPEGSQSAEDLREIKGASVRGSGLVRALFEIAGPRTRPPPGDAAAAARDAGSRGVDTGGGPA